MTLSNDSDYYWRSIRQCPEFHDLSDEELKALISIGNFEEFKKGQEVFTINHQGKKFYVVIYGRLNLRLKSNLSKEYKMGELFGEVAILGDTFRFGTIIATEESMLISFNREDLFNSEKISRALALKLTLNLAKKVIGYFEVDNLAPTEKLIQTGECDYVEFKRSIHEHNKENIVRCLAGFMNLNGGTVLCGVDDKTAEIEGVDLSKMSFDDIQKMMRIEIEQRLGSSFRHYVSYDLEQINGKTIIRIDCHSSKSPVFFKAEDKKSREKEYFVVRSGSENVAMDRTREVINYVQERFKNK